MDALVGLVIGWSLGGLTMWIWFVSAGLIRSRSEWYAIRKAQGKSVPDNWEDDEP